jgi:hypothetical protein
MITTEHKALIESIIKDDIENFVRFVSVKKEYFFNNDRIANLLVNADIASFVISRIADIIRYSVDVNKNTGINVHLSISAKNIADNITLFIETTFSEILLSSIPLNSYLVRFIEYSRREKHTTSFKYYKDLACNMPNCTRVFINEPKGLIMFKIGSTTFELKYNEISPLLKITNERHTDSVKINE